MNSADEPTVARVLDAAANRAREAVRVLEDYARFVRGDAFASRLLKELRHDLAGILCELPPTALLAARETIQDVGTAIQVNREGLRRTPRDVAAANAKRLQEALRTLEEFGKLCGPALGAKFEGLRYRAYTLERTVALGDDADARLAGATLYVLVSASDCPNPFEWTVREAVAGGARLIQLREKSLPDQLLVERARQVRRWTREAGALFIVNDRPDIARLAEADGVHVGQDDLSVFDARRIVGCNALIGVSTHNLEQVRAAVRDGASYLGVGPTFASATKGFESLAGLEFVRQATSETSLPAFVLGGVTAENVSDVVAAGGDRVAVSAAVVRSDNPRAAAAALVKALGK